MWPLRPGTAGRTISASPTSYFGDERPAAAYVCRHPHMLRETKPIDGSQMKAFRDPTFSDRLGNSSAAKKAALDRFRAKAEDPAVAELRAARAAAAAERELRAAERAEARRIEQERQAAQKAADEIAARAEREARQIREADEMLVLEAQRKTERDARYAARKARKAG